MIDGTYKLKVDVPFGRKEGTVVLRTEGDDVHAEIDAPIVGKQCGQGKVDGDEFVAKGSGKFKLVGTIDYTIRGKVSGDNLHIDVQSSKGEIKLDGVRV